MRAIRHLPMGALVFATIGATSLCFGHGSVVDPISRVYWVYLQNPDNPQHSLAQNAVDIDGTLSYYTWNEVSRNIPEAVVAGLPPGFDYSPWMPDGQLASAGRVDPMSNEYPRTYAGLDQVSPDWPTTDVTAGETIEVDFWATAPHDPSVWDVWMTTPDWNPNTALNWGQMEFLGRPTVILDNSHYYFDLEIPADRSGHHVLWIAWQRDDPVGEVFISTSDIFVNPATNPDVEFQRGDCNADGTFDVSDAVKLLDFAFPPPGGPVFLYCQDACDCNDDGALGVGDAICLLNGLFGSMTIPPAAPHPDCGTDPTVDSLEDCGTAFPCP